MASAFQRFRKTAGRNTPASRMIMAFQAYMNGKKGSTETNELRGKADFVDHEWLNSMSTDKVYYPYQTKKELARGAETMGKFKDTLVNDEFEQYLGMLKDYEKK